VVRRINCNVPIPRRYKNRVAATATGTVTSCSRNLNGMMISGGCSGWDGHGWLPPGAETAVLLVRLFDRHDIEDVDFTFPLMDGIKGSEGSPDM